MNLPLSSDDPSQRETPRRAQASLASQEQQVVLHMLKVVGRHTKNFEDEGFIGFRYTLQALTLQKPNGGINDGFGREAMVFANFEPEDIASQVKAPIWRRPSDRSL